MTQTRPRFTSPAKTSHFSSTQETRDDRSALRLGCVRRHRANNRVAAAVAEAIVSPTAELFRAPGAEAGAECELRSPSSQAGVPHSGCSAVLAARDPHSGCGAILAVRSPYSRCSAVLEATRRRLQYIFYKPANIAMLDTRKHTRTRTRTHTHCEFEQKDGAGARVRY